MTPRPAKVLGGVSIPLLDYLMSGQEKQPSAFPATAEKVKNFYDRYPYPRPVENLDAYYRKKSIKLNLEKQ